MKKKLLFISLCTALSLNVSAQEEQMSSEKEKELLQILNSLSVDTVKKEAKNDVKIKEQTANKELVEKYTPPTITVNGDDYHQQERKDQHKNALEIITDVDLVISESSEQFEEQDEFEVTLSNNDHVYLLNIPIKTRIYANSDFHIYPFREGMIFDDGKIRASSPLNFSDQTTFCYFAVEKSGHSRRLKGVDVNDHEKSLSIEANQSDKIVFKSHLDPSKVITKYETAFKLDNPHIKVLKCLTTEKNLPLTIGDFHFETGGMFRFEFPEIIDIN